MYKTIKFYDKRGITRYQSAFIAVYESDGKPQKIDSGKDRKRR